MSIDPVSAAMPQTSPVYAAAAHTAQPAPTPPPAADPDHDGDVDPAGHVDVRV